MTLVLREEIVCVIILAFLIFYYSINKVKDKEKPFLLVVCFGLLHVILDMVTVITVNHLDTVPPALNEALHVGFYISGILFIIGFCNYVVSIAGVHLFTGRQKWLMYIPLAFFVILMMFLPMQYVEGNNTNYSYGPLAFVGYGLFVVYCIMCLVILVIMRNRLEKRVKRALFPLIVVMFIAIVAQALVPELLMTGGNATIICIGMFVALDNPDKDFMEQALWDFPTGLKNRNCYNRDVAKYVQRYTGKKRRGAHGHANGSERGGARRGTHTIGFVVADLNYLKKTNDEHGHPEGDALIAAAASTLREQLRHAENVYRIGGDEFVGVYLDVSDEKAAEDMRNAKEAADRFVGLAVPLKIAMGYAAGDVCGDVEAIFQEADGLMYEDKGEMKRV